MKGQGKPEVLSGGGELGELIRLTNWAQTPLGPISEWPRSLKIVVQLMLDSRYAIWAGWGPELTFLYNDAYRHMTLGKKHPWALGRPAHDVWAEAWDALGSRVREVVDHGRATYDENLLLLLDRSGSSEETYHTFSYSPIPDDAGNRGGLLCIVVENTDRYIAERRLKILHETAERIANSRTMDQLFRPVRQINNSSLYDLPFCLIYLMAADGKHLQLVFHTGVDAKYLAAHATLSVTADRPWPIAEILASKELVHMDLVDRIANPPSSPWGIPVGAAAGLSITQPGQAQSAGVLIVGLSPLLAFDNAYRGFIRLIGRQIATGISDVRATEAERERAESLARLDRAKTSFFSNTSHEFRTPLTLILGPLEQALTRAPGANQIEFSRDEIEVIHRNGLRLLKLVNTLLDFSRIQAGRADATFEPVKLEDYTAELASVFRSVMINAGLEYIVECQPLPEPAYVDRDMWEKIVLNLISNAFKYTLAGRVTVSLRLTADRKDAELAVIDTGVGIPEQELPRIFERFHRIEGQAGRTHEGIGIGLALVAQLVNIHRGRIRVESLFGRGSTFTVTIPLGSSHLPQDRIGAARSPLAGSHVQPFMSEALRWISGDHANAETGRAMTVPQIAPLGSAGKPRVLIADDNADMRDYLALLLSDNYEIQTVPDGEAALRAASQKRPDAIISDVMMPRLDGFGLVRAIRASAELRTTPIVLLTARAGEEASVEGFEAGADDYIAKPFRARELMARIAACIDLARNRRQVEEELLDSNQALQQRLSQEAVEREKNQEVLRHSQKLEAIGQLTGGVVHDFNNMLQVIVGNLTLLQQFALKADLPKDRINKWIAGALRGAYQAANLSHRLLEFARRQPLDRKPLNINHLITGMTELLRRTLGESIEIESILEDAIWPVLVDSVELESALLNLAVNARDAMPRGGRLTIKTANVDRGSTGMPFSQYATITVGDTGTGMAPEVLERAIEPFFTTKKPGEGTGLGLAQVHGFVEQSRGDVNIRSTVGEGTEVTIYLPRFLEHSATISHQQIPLQAARAEQNETVLIVEDREDVRSNVTAMLAALNYRVLAARDGWEALRILESTPKIDLLLSDLGLPGGLTGRDLAEHARLRQPAIKVLFSSGYLDVRGGPAPERLSPGEQLIRKPFSLTELATGVREALRQ